MNLAKLKQKLEERGLDPVLGELVGLLQDKLEAIDDDKPDNLKAKLQAAQAMLQDHETRIAQLESKIPL